jgi:hypothetical protein
VLPQQQEPQVQQPQQVQVWLQTLPVQPQQQEQPLPLVPPHTTL